MIARTRNSITFSAALLLPCTALYWLWTTPTAIGGSTYIALSVLALATSVITFNTWRSAQSTGIPAPLIPEADIVPAMSTSCRAPSGEHARAALGSRSPDHADRSGSRAPCTRSRGDRRPSFRVGRMIAAAAPPQWTRGETLAAPLELLAVAWLIPSRSWRSGRRSHLA